MKQLVLDLGLAAVPTLEHFLGPHNQAALQHLRCAVASGVHGWIDQPRQAPMPTYLWGEAGSGKSHLLLAVREALRERGATVGWLDPALFDPPEFSSAWAALLLDDVQQYSPTQQQAAFNWLVNAQDERRWVLAAGSLPPADLALRDDLRSRLGWGQVFALQPQGDAGRRAVLRQAAEARGLTLSDEVVDFMLARFSRDLSSLMRLLAQLDDFALQTHRPITIPLLKTMLESL